MAKGRLSNSDEKSRSNPLGGVGRRPGSYVGDLDSLLAEVGDTPATTRGSEEVREESGARPGEKRGEREAPQSKPQVKRINLDVPSDLHQRFKGATGMAGRTMTDVLQELIRSYLDRTTE